MVVDDTMEVAGVNDRAQLAVAEAELRDRINERWMRRGVTMWDPERTYIDVDVELEPDVVLLPGVILQGACVVGPTPRSGPTPIWSTPWSARVRWSPRACAGGPSIGAEARVGPFAVLDEGTEVPPGGVVGPAGRSDPAADGRAGVSGDGAR